MVAGVGESNRDDSRALPSKNSLSADQKTQADVRAVLMCSGRILKDNVVSLSDPLPFHLLRYSTQSDSP